MDKKKPSVSIRLTQPYVVWPIIGALVCVIGLLAAYTVMLRGELSRRQPQAQNTPVLPSPSPAQARAVSPRPTVNPGTDVDNTYTNTKEFTYSFKHLDGYKVVNQGHRLLLEKITEDGKSVYSTDDPNNLIVRMDNYYIWNKKSRSDNYTPKDVLSWLESWASSAQCSNGINVSLSQYKGKPYYYVEQKCGANGWYDTGYWYVFELHPRNGDFLVIQSTDAPLNEQMKLVADTFSLLQ